MILQTYLNKVHEIIKMVSGPSPDLVDFYEASLRYPFGPSLDLGMLARLVNSTRHDPFPKLFGSFSPASLQPDLQVKTRARA